MLNLYLKITTRSLFRKILNGLRMFHQHKKPCYTFTTKETFDMVITHWLNKSKNTHKTSKAFYSLEECLKYAVYISPAIRHFLRQVHSLYLALEQSNAKITFFVTKSDLKFCKKFLHWEAKGILLNLISFYWPSISIWVDRINHNFSPNDCITAQQQPVG